MAVRTIEEIQDALDAIVDPDPEADAPDLTDEQQADVEALLAELEQAKARKERIDALTAKVRAGREKATPALHTSSKDKGGDTIENAFAHYLRTGQANADLSELRNAQSAGTDSEGGYTVPEGFRQKIVDRMKAFGGIANVVETIETETGNRLPWPTLDDTGNSGQIVAEGGTFAGGADLVFGQVELNAYSYMAGGAGGLPLRISRELVQDSAFDIVGLVSRKLGERLARIQSTHLVTGTGTAQPKGITTGLTGIEMLAAGAVGYDDLLNYVHSVDPAYRASARWAFNDASLEMIRGVVDVNGRPLLKGTDEGVAGGPGGETLLGYPVTIDQAFPDFTPASQTVNWGVFGDLSEGYVIRRVRAVELLVNPYARMANRQIEYSVWARMDATQQNVNAYKALTGFVA